MKPIHLRFKGLHSYREMQEVDFEGLCQGGLFGIFGPTGSGKSTVLDAITLALYARVERAGGQRQGILNEACDDLLVDFTFELGAGEQKRRYQVERRYRRTGPTSVAVSFARLTEHRGEHQEVIADKDRDVTEAVERILGLTHSDFTRAVVLPQGKFAEFLHMAGSDRRGMLERLFALQAYGQRLSERISSHLVEVENRLSKIQGAQDALGDASAKAVQEAKRAAKEADAEAEAARERVEKARAAHKKAEDQRRIQAELLEVRAELHRLDQAAPQIEAAERELREAETAEPIRRELDEVERAERERTQAELDCRTADEQLAKAQRAQEEALAAYDRARIAREKEEPELLVLRSRLQEGLGKEERLTGCKGKADELKQRLDGLMTKLEAVEKDLAEVRNRIATDEAEQLEKETELRRLTVEPSRRRAIQKAAVALDRLREVEASIARERQAVEGAEQRAEQAAAEHARAERQAAFHRNELEERQKELERLEASPPTSDDDLNRDADFLARAHERVAQLRVTEGELDRVEMTLQEATARAAELTDQLRQAKSDLEAALAAETEARTAAERAEEALRLAELEHQAAALAAQLTEGTPCPVCGSPHHPSPAQQPEGNAELRAELQKAQARLKAKEDDRASAEERTRHLEQQLTDTQRLSEHTEEERRRLLSRRAGVYAQLPASWHDLRSVDIEVKLAGEQAGYLRRKEAAEAWRVQVATLRRDIEDQRRTVDKAAEAVAQLGSQLARTEAELEAARAALLRAEDERDSHAAAFRQAAGALSPEDVEAEAERIHAADARAETLQGEVDALRSGLTEMRNMARDLESRQNALQNESVQTQADLRVLQQEIDGLSEELTTLTGGRPVSELLAEVNARLEKLVENETRVHKACDEAAALLARAERQRDAAKHSLDKALEHEKAVKERLHSHLAEAGFGSVEAAREALRSGEAREALRNRIAQHERAVATHKERQVRLEQELDDAWLDDEAWEGIVQELAAAEAAREKALFHLSGARTKAAELQQRHEDWQALEKDRKEEQALKDRLQQLQQLCRGRLFVEFVAEEYLASVTAEASRRLANLTSGRYALEVDSSGGFVVRDDANGGVRRPVSSLSGGETFVTSLALALALSKQIQLHGTYPLEFFFLDEGFGTLDPELLETVMTSLEKLRNEQVSIGIISHVPELRQRVARRLIVHHARESDRGSYLEFERG